MSSHRHRHRHQTIRISILLRPNWFTPRVLTVCSVCFKIYAQCGCDLGGHRTAETRGSVSCQFSAPRVRISFWRSINNGKPVL